MANYYTQFSIALPIDPARKAEVEDWIDEHQDREYGDHLYDEVTMKVIQEGTGAPELWVYGGVGDSENGDVELAAELIQEYLEKFDIDDGFYMTWANTCSKPRVNAFGGGEAVIHRNEIYWGWGTARNDATNQGVNVVGMAG